MTCGRWDLLKEALPKKAGWKDSMDPQEVLQTEFSELFVRGMRDRMIVSFYKYGPVAKAYPSKVDAIASLEKRIQKYRDTGNTEWLMDAANFAMIEFMFPAHKDAHFRGTDSGESPGRIDKGGQATKDGNADVDGRAFDWEAYKRVFGEQAHDNLKRKKGLL